MQYIHITDPLIYDPNGLDSKTLLGLSQGLQSNTLDIKHLLQCFSAQSMPLIKHCGLTYQATDHEEIQHELDHCRGHQQDYRIMLKKSCLGELRLFWSSPPTAEISKHAGILVTLLAPAINNAMAHQRALSQAYLDSLTKLNNRNAFNQAIKREIELATRYKRPLSIMMLDIDRFKRINDIHGHTAGDSVLKQFAIYLLKYLRCSDSIFRYGGEEFVILLSSTPLEGADFLAKRTCRYIDQQDFTFNPNDANDIKNLDVSVSIGVTQKREKEKSDELLQRVDKLLYKAKKSGRNCVVSED